MSDEKIKLWTESGVLKPDVHERLILGIERYAEEANIPAKYIATPLSDHLEDWQLKAVARIRSSPYAGFVFTGDSSVALHKMQVIAGALIRNFIDVKVMMSGQAFRADSQQARKIEVLIVPDFFVGNVSELHYDTIGVLADRMQANKKTILYVSDYGKLKNKFTEFMFNLIESNWVGM